MAVPQAAERHMLARFSYGFTPGLYTALLAAGGPAAWFERQLRPGDIPDARADALADWFPYLRSTAQRRFNADQSGKRSGWEQSMDLIRWTILRRIYSERQLFEVMVDFWSNLLHVPAASDGWMYRTAYDRMIRRNALGRFRDLLTGATLSAAMQVYLNSAESTKDALNENHGRELLELHSVGIAAGYTEPMVRDSARLLTGYHVGTWEKIRHTYSPDDHATGPVSILGFSAANDDPDGRATLRAYLAHLAGHPATATRIATRLCRRFVSERPSPAVVAAVAEAYRASDTDIPTTLRALVAHPEFAAGVDGLVRTPALDAVATYRALTVRVKKPTRDDHFGHAVNYVLDDMGEGPFMWPAPNGFPQPAAAWASVARMRGSWDMHITAAGGWWPKNAGWRDPRSFFPAAPVRFDAAVDAVARRLLGRPATPAMVSAAATWCDVAPTSPIDDLDDFGEWPATLVVAVVLDSPEHLRR